MIVHPMVRGSLRLRFLLLSAFTLVLALTGRSAFAAPTDCIEDAPDGRAVCFAPEPGPWGVGPCENTPDLVQNQRAWCKVGGGTFNNPDCPGFIPYSEEDIPERSIAFLNILTNSGCSIVSDTGWN